MKILLLSPPAKQKHLMKNARCDFVSWSGCSWWPMILGQLGAYLEGRGFSVKLLDAQASGLSGEDTRRCIIDYDPDRTLVFTSRMSLTNDLVWASYLKSRKDNARSCLFSPFFFAVKAKEISRSYDVDFISGEPETGFVEWLEGKSGWIDGGPLPIDEYHKIGWASKFMMKNCAYQDYMSPSELYPFIDVLTSRGCSWGKCTFCLWPKTYRRQYIVRDMRDVIDEIEWIESMGIFKSIMIEDDTFTPARAQEFAHMKTIRRIELPWSCLIRADIPIETLRVMKKSGLLNLHVGYESASNKTLKAARKGLTREQMTLWTEIAKELKIRIHGDFQIGIDETEEEIYETINWACKLRPHTAQFQIHIPYMGGNKGHHPDRLRELARFAYKKFYGNPRSWPAIIEQFGKPRVIGQSLKRIFGG